MYEYMCGMQAKFFKEPEFPELEQKISKLYDELADHMNREERKNC